jgi:hypothetical protein
MRILAQEVPVPKQGTAESGPCRPERTVMRGAPKILLPMLCLLAAGLSACSESDSSTTSGISTLPQPQVVGEWKSKIGESIESLAIHDGAIYAVSGYDGVLVFRMSVSNTPEKATNFLTNTRVRSILLSASEKPALLYAVGSDKNNNSVLQAYSLADPFDPELVYSSSNLPGSFPNSLALSGTSVYLGDEFNGLMEFDRITNPPQLREKRRMGIGGVRLRAIAVDTDRKMAAVAAEEDGVIMVDLVSGKIAGRASNPLSMACTIQISNRFVAVGDRMNGIILYDMTKPDQPLILGSYSTAGEAMDIRLNNKELTVSDGGNGLVHLDISGPKNISNTWRFSCPGITYQSVQVSNLVFMACGADGMRIIRIP